MASDAINLMELPTPHARPHDDDDDPRPKKLASLVHPLPPGLVMTEWAVGLLRAYLEREGLNHYHISHVTDLDIEDVELNLEALGEAGAHWKPLPAATADGEPLAALTHGATAAKVWPTGVLHLPGHQVLLARWYWVDEIEVFRKLWLIAAPTPAAYLTLRDEVRRSRRRRGARKWQIVRNGWTATESIPRECGPEVASRLLLADELRQRIDAEIVNFFSPQVAALYAGLHVPYRRGVLLHGPPGNGKTSMIRAIGAALPEVPMLVLRPSTRFNADALHYVLKRWTAIAPAALIIEDLDWLLKQVNISAFLNALDGIDSTSGLDDDASAPANTWQAPSVKEKSSGHGLLLLATTNHPEQLDPAINNRPGRFDVVIEMPPPKRVLRRMFFAQHLGETDPTLLEQLAEKTEGLSFAHLQEVIGGSALTAIHAGRLERTGADLLAAVARVREANESSDRGFLAKPATPFGLAARSKDA